MNARAHLYVSPHLDDAALSCGGRIWQQVQAGERVSIVTVFAGVPAPDAPLSPFAQELHSRWGAAGSVAARREEDAAALALLGAEGVYWSYVDCIYRQAADGCFLCDSEEALFGEVHPAEDALIAELADHLQMLAREQDGTIYAPLAVGNHVDHQVVRRAVEGLGGVVYYEDYPYAARPGMVEAALGEGQWQAELVSLSQEALEVKIAAIACYDSQLTSLDWADAAEMAAAVRAFAGQIGGSVPAERYWAFGRSIRPKAPPVKNSTAPGVFVVGNAAFGMRNVGLVPQGTNSHSSGQLCKVDRLINSTDRLWQRPVSGPGAGPVHRVAQKRRSALWGLGTNCQFAPRR